MKSHEEMKAAVFAELERICHKDGFINCVKFGEYMVYRDWSEFGMYEFDPKKERNVGNMIFAIKRARTPNYQVTTMYRLLGLETGDAIAERDELHQLKIDSLNTSIIDFAETLASVQAKYVAAVKALENLCHVMKHRFPLSPNTIHELVEAEKALEAYKFRKP